MGLGSNHDPRASNRVAPGSAHGPRLTAHVSSSGRVFDPGPPAPDPASSSWVGLLREHLTRYPLAQAEDVYKFIHQSVFGPAHAIPSPDEARRYLEEEIAGLPAGPAEEPLLDTLSVGPPLARVNLRPFVAAGGDTGRLLDAFFATASSVRGDPSTMAGRIEAAIALLRELGRAEDAGRLGALASDRAAAGYPATHHGSAYRDAYHPAYRVVRLDLLDTGGVAPGAATGRF